MLLSSKYRKLFNNIKNCAKISIEMCKKDEKLKPGINYLSDHFLFDLPMKRNLRIAKSLAKSIPQNLKMLDWGCGYGDVSYMLKTLRPDLDITLFDVLSSEPWEILTNKEGMKKIISADETKLPFENSKFDAIMGVGVFEHVKDQKASLIEIHRVLKPGGVFYVFLYPNKFSYTERFQKNIGNPHHDKPLSRNELERLLKANGFNIEVSRYELMMPFIMSRFPFGIRRVYNELGNTVIILNHIFEKIPLLNKLSSNLMIVCIKKRSL